MDKQSQEHKWLGRKNRRDTLIVIGLAVVIIAGAFLLTRWINPGYSKSPYTREADVLDDHVSISAYGKKQSQVESAVDAAFQRIYEIDAIANRFRTDSEISSLNANAADHPVAVSGDLWNMITSGMDVYRQSNGLFDITVAPLVDLWDVLGRAARGDAPPSDAEIKQAMQSVGSDKLVLDQADHTVFFSRPGMGIDVGGIAKGYALEAARDVLESRGVTTGIIDMISTSLTMGEKPASAGGPNWEIAISNPRSGDAYLGTLTVPGGTYISTSGDNQRYFDYDGVRYSHIIDPRTGYPATQSISVTVIGAANGSLSDATTKPAFILGYPDGMNWVEKTQNAQAVMVDPSGQVHYSQGLASSIESMQSNIDPSI
jgi:thiamine biosynthesis lipoprotein